MYTRERERIGVVHCGVAEKFGRNAKVRVDFPLGDC